jgi:hypothetical protein
MPELIKLAKFKEVLTKSLVQKMFQQETVKLKLILYKPNQFQLPLMLQTGLYINQEYSPTVLPD